MAEHSHIEWTDATWNPVTGCSVVSPGCANCYAMRLAGMRLRDHPSRAGLTQDTKAGPVWTGKVRLNEQWLDQPLRWRRPRRIFVCAHGDLFHEGVPDEWIDRVFAAMALAPQHTFQVLTKRAARMRAYLSDPAQCVRLIPIAQELRWQGKTNATSVALGWQLPNVWLGVSAERQAEADARIPDLLATPAAVRFVSAEPLLGAVDLGNVRPPERYEIDALRGHDADQNLPCERLDWVIAGGESGPGARPAHPDWFRALRDQCAAAGTPFFFKQWGSWLPDRMLESADKRGIIMRADGTLPTDPDVERMMSGTFDFAGWQHFAFIGKKAAGARLDGVEHRAFPGPP